MTILIDLGACGVVGPTLEDVSGTGITLVPDRMQAIRSHGNRYDRSFAAVGVIGNGYIFARLGFPLSVQREAFGQRDNL